MKFEDLLAHRRIVITAGTGGVGKTSLAATLALQAAVMGKRAVVITVDPARRLATSLGVTTLGDEPRDLTARLKQARPDCKGTFAAVTPDARKTLEAFVDSICTDPDLRARIQKNPLFQLISTDFSGAHEYLAIQRLRRLCARSEYDFIVLDTPPGQQVLTFLDAPRALLRFYDEPWVQKLFGGIHGLAEKGLHATLRAIESLTGSGFMSHLLDFAAALFALQRPFTQSLLEIDALLRSDAVGFLLVAVPQSDLLGSVQTLGRSLERRGLHFDGLLLNRTLGYLGEYAKNPTPQTNPPNCTSNAEDLVRELLETERIMVAALEHSRIPYRLFPELARDVHSLEDLAQLAQTLLDSPASV